MVEKIVNLKVTDNIEQTTKNVVNLKSQLKEAVLEVQKMSDAYGASSKEAINAAKRAAELKDKIEDANDAIKSFKGEGAFIATSKAIGSVSSGLAAYQGALGLVGVESKDLEKQLLKVQSAMAISQGLAGVEDLGRSFSQLKVVAVNAFNGIKSAIGSTGIGLLVIALGTIYAYWDDIKEAVSGVSEEQKKSNLTLNDSLKKQKDTLSNLDAQDATLKRQGKSEREILELKEKQVQKVIDLQIQTLESDIKLRKSAHESSIRNKEMLTEMLKVLLLPINYTLKAIDLIGKAMGKNFDLVEKFNGGIAKLVFDPEEVKKQGELATKEEQKALNELYNQRDGYHNQIKTLDATAKKAKDDAAKEALKKEEELSQKRIDALDDELTAMLDQEQRIKDNEARKSQIKIDALEQELNDIIEYDERVKKYEEIAAKNKEEQLQTNLSNVHNILSLGGQKFAKIQKALAIGEIVRDTIRSVNAATGNEIKVPAFIGAIPNPVKAPSMISTALGIAGAIAKGAASIAAINSESTSISGGGKIGSGASGGNGAAAPSFNIVGQNSNNQLAQSIAQKQSQPIEAYVVSGNISNAQSLDRNRVNTATFN